jgi:hypothetical protein
VAGREGAVPGAATFLFAFENQPVSSGSSGWRGWFRWRWHCSPAVPLSGRGRRALKRPCALIWCSSLPTRCTSRLNCKGADKVLALKRPPTDVRTREKCRGQGWLAGPLATTGAPGSMLRKGRNSRVSRLVWGRDGKSGAGCRVSASSPPGNLFLPRLRAAELEPCRPCAVCRGLRTHDRKDLRDSNNYQLSPRWK